MPKQARKEFERSEQAADAGDIQKSIEHLKKALEIYPDYMQAHNNLGVRCVHLRQYQDALAHFDKAAELDPGSAKVHMNRSAALFALGRQAEAEAAARRALDLDPSFSKARYGLAVALFAQQKNREALEHLKRVAEEYPKAHVVMGEILLSEGNREAALLELKQYLGTGEKENREGGRGLGCKAGARGERRGFSRTAVNAASSAPGPALIHHVSRTCATYGRAR